MIISSESVHLVEAETVLEVDICAIFSQNRSFSLNVHLTVIDSSGYFHLTLTKSCSKVKYHI
jgi:hypothetical protein